MNAEEFTEKYPLTSFILEATVKSIVLFIKGFFVSAGVLLAYSLFIA